MSSRMDTRTASKGRVAAGNRRAASPKLPASAGPRNRDLRLGFLIHDVSRMRRRAFDEFMKPLGITRAQWWVIAHLSRHDGMMQSQLATILDVGKASLGKIVDRLESGGFIERRQHPLDRRAKSVFMTRKARELITKMQSAESSYDKIVLGQLNEADRDELVRLLKLVKDSLATMALGEADDGE